MLNKRFSKLKVEIMHHCSTYKILIISDNFSLALRERAGVRVSRAFTLAEVLITLVVIGVVAAVTLPMLNINAAARANSQRQANIVAKITHATDMMRANGVLGKFNTTDEFVDELQKYLKINKRCDANHIAECWPTATIINREGETYEVSNAKTRKDLGLDTDNNNGDIDNVGLILADGAHIILTYNPSSEGLTLAQESSWTTKTLPTGNGEYTDFEYTSNTTGGLAFVMDVNGAKSPNKESVDNKYYDIRSFNEAHFSSESCNQFKVGSSKYCTIDSYSPINCTTITDDNRKYCTGLKDESGRQYTTTSSSSTDYLAGAIKACDELNATMPTKTEMTTICNSNKSNGYKNLGVSSGVFWTSTVGSGCPSSCTWDVNIANCAFDYYGGGDRNRALQVICIGN